jgi:hypothetical protein
VNHPQIAAFARLAKENAVPTRKLEGEETRLTRTVHDFAYDPIHDEIVTSSPFAQAILTFRGGANGQEAPIRIIQGPHTQIMGSGDGDSDRMGIDAVNGEYYIGNRQKQILVFDRGANGDVAPKRILGGPNARFGTNPTIRVDAAHNLLFVTGDGGGGGGGRGRLLIFDRTASGDAESRGVIRGPTGNQFVVYNDMIIIHSYDSVFAWSIYETGDSVQPRWKFPAYLGPQAQEYTRQRGIDVDPVHKEVIVASASGNQIRIFSMPELFDDKVPR